MQMFTIIYGPPATGKTTNADLLKKAFKCDFVFDDSQMREIVDAVGNIMVLTTDQKLKGPRGNRKLFQFAARIPISVARATVGDRWIKAPVEKKRDGISMPTVIEPLVLLLVDPMQDHLKWAIVEGTEVRRRGQCISSEEIKEIAWRESIRDVFIEEGFRTLEVRKIAAENRWHCVKSLSHRKRDGIAEMIDKACNLQPGE